MGEVVNLDDARAAKKARCLICALVVLGVIAGGVVFLTRKA